MAVQGIDLSQLDLAPKKQPVRESGKTDLNFLNINSKIDSLVIKILPGAESENKKFLAATFTHWNLGADKRLSLVCPEKTFPNSGVTCPVCQKMRELLGRGALTEETKKLLEATGSTKVRCIVLKQNGENMPRDKVTVLTQNSLTFYRWLVEKAKDPDAPDFVSYNQPFVISIKRAQGGKGFDRDIVTWEPSRGQVLYFPTDEEAELHKSINERLTWERLTRFNPSEEQQEKINSWLTSF